MTAERIIRRDILVGPSPTTHQTPESFSRNEINEPTQDGAISLTIVRPGANYGRLSIPYIPLSPDKKREIGQRLQEVRQLISKTDPLPDTDLYREEKKLETQLIHAHSRLVPWAMKHYGLGRPGLYQDVSQAGFHGLTRAVKAYDPDKGSFTTYAAFWIRKYMQESLRMENESGIIPSENGIEALMQARTAREALMQENGKEVTLSRTCDMIQFKPITKDAAVSASRATRIPKRFNAEVELQGLTLEETIPDTETLSLDEVVIKQELRDYVAAMFSDLSNKEKYGQGALTPNEITVLQLRFGLAEKPEVDLIEIGGVLGLKKGTVWKISPQALMKIRNSPHAEKLREYLPV